MSVNLAEAGRIISQVATEQRPITVPYKGEGGIVQHAVVVDLSGRLKPGEIKTIQMHPRRQSHRRPRYK